MATSKVFDILHLQNNSKIFSSSSIPENYHIIDRFIRIKDRDQESVGAKGCMDDVHSFVTFLASLRIIQRQG